MLSVTPIGQEAVDVAVVEGEVEGGWVLQDSYNGADWRDLEVLDEKASRFFLSEVPTATRLFRAAEKALATPQQALDEARAKWEATGLTTYQFRTSTSVMGFPTDDVTLVKDGQASEWVSVLPPGGPPFAWGDQSVEDLFDRIQNAIDTEAHVIRARYHPELGYPESAYIDQSEMIADEEWGMRVLGAPATPDAARDGNAERWRRSGVRNYQFDLRFESSWVRWEGTVRVIDGTPEVIAGGVPPLEHIVMTMEGYLSYLGKALGEGAEAFAAYHPELGYPEFLSKDWYLTIVDGPGERFWISGFQKLAR